jgi:hypothetical protein
MLAYVLGDCLVWVVFCENYRNSTKNWATFFYSKSFALFSQEMDRATFWATFFTNASGHPGLDRPLMPAPHVGGGWGGWKNLFLTANLNFKVWCRLFITLARDVVLVP